MVAAPEANPTVARRELAVYFRNLREQRGFSLNVLMEVLGVKQPQASRLDTGARGFGPDQVRLLCDRYELGERECQRLLELAIESRRRAWWQQYDLDDSYRTLIGLEQAAESISEYCCTVIPGLLQTRRYAEAAVTSSQIGIQGPVIQHAVDVRMRRQKILDRVSPPRLSAILDEAVLARPASGQGVMREQLEHLLTMAARPRVTVRVIGYEAGPYPTGSAQFILLSMGRRLPDVYYTDSQLGHADTSDEQDLRIGRDLWETLQATALDRSLSMARIEHYRDQQAKIDRTSSR